MPIILPFLAYITKIWKGIVYAGVDEFNYFDPNRSVCLGINLMSAGISFVNLVVCPIIYYLTANVNILTGGLIEAALLSCVIRLNFKRKYEISNIVFFLAMNASIYYYSSTLGQSAEILLMYFFLMGLIFFVFEKALIRIFCVIVTIFRIVLLKFNLKYLISNEPEIGGQANNFIHWLFYTIIIFLVLAIFFAYSKEHGRLKKLYGHAEDVKSSLALEERMNQSKNILFKHMSHDIKSVYSSIELACRALAHSAEIDEKLLNTKSVINDLVNASNYYGFLLDDFLEYSKFADGTLENIHYEEVDIRSEIEQIVTLHRHMAEKKGVTINLSVDDEIPGIIICDKVKVKRIVLNLLSNALKFTRSNRSIFIKLDIDGNNQLWKLSVTDEGEGLSDEELGRIFLPYVTGKNIVNNPDGIGLGLPIVKHLVEILKGEIKVISKAAKGSSFIVSIPFQLNEQLAQ